MILAIQLESLPSEARMQQLSRCCCRSRNPPYPFVVKPLVHEHRALSREWATNQSPGQDVLYDSIPLVFFFSVSLFRWFLAYQKALSFRFSHYFVSFLSEGTSLLSGVGTEVSQEGTQVTQWWVVLVMIVISSSQAFVESLSSLLLLCRYGRGFRIHPCLSLLHRRLYIGCGAWLDELTSNIDTAIHSY